MQVSNLVSRSTKNFGKTKFSYAKSYTLYSQFKKILVQIICANNGHSWTSIIHGTFAACRSKRQMNSSKNCRSKYFGFAAANILAKNNHFFAPFGQKIMILLVKIFPPSLNRVSFYLCK